MSRNINQSLLPLFAITAITLPLYGAPKKNILPGDNTAIMWQDPGDISARDLFYGKGGEAHSPKGPFIYDKEDMNGTNPKFVVHDADGVKWKVKLGEEAGPETAASRLVWAVGYYTDEDYFMPEFRAGKMPAHLKRGQDRVEPDGTIRNVRLKRYLSEEKKLGEWSWKDSPFAGTREFNGLRLMMALINNWDLKDGNNSVYRVDGKLIYLVSDLGASFGTSGRSYTRADSKGNLQAYQHSKFIASSSDGSVNFNVPGRPAFIHLLEAPEYVQRLHMEWIGKDIPLEDARWIGHLLSQITPKQIEAAFRASGYSPEQVGAFANVVEERIGQLIRL
jgi:hypothetical protein